MKKLLYVLTCLIMMIFLGGQLQALVQITGVDSRDSADLDDNDEIYRPGQMVQIIVQYSSDKPPVGTVEINSEMAGYESGTHALTKGAGNTFEYVWNTSGLREADDYVVSIILTENAEQEDTDNSLTIQIDNMPPRILTVISHDRDDITDDDGIYHAGQNIAIDVQVTDKTRLEAAVQIKSDAVRYDSGSQRLTDQGNGLYRYIWITTGLNAAKDYAATVTFRDQAGWESQDSSLRMEIDNTEPKNGKVSINDRDVYTLSASVNLAISADSATKMHVSGDVIDDVSTFEWVSYAGTLRVTLAEGDGLKRVSVRFMDDASNQSAPAEDTIILDEEPPVIDSVGSHDETDTLDDDGIYHAGQAIVIVVEIEDSDLVELDGVVQITSAGVSYDSGLQTLNIGNLGEYTYTWNTVGLLEASDYAVWVKLTDPSHREVKDNSLIITIDNTPPSGGQVRINDGQAETDSRSVILTLSSPGDPREMFIDGDLIDDTNTFQWIPYTDRVVANLTDTDGEKEVVARFRDAARNVSGITTATILLDRQAPTSTSITIQDGAEYTVNRDVSLKLQAENAAQMLIDGDVVDDPLTFDYINYRGKLQVKLSAGDGVKHVGVVFVNKVGIRSDRIEDTIILDTSEPVILSVNSRDSQDPQDDDGVFHPGQKVIISVTAESGEAQLDAGIRIQSQNTAYDTGQQGMVREADGATFTYLWDTTALRASNDYMAFVELTDAAGHKTVDSDLRITIDSLPPTRGKVIINDGEETTDLRTVRLAVSAVDAASIFLSGDLADDSNTFQWISYRTSLTANLAGEDGQKTVYVKFMDAAGNQSAEVQDSITLDRKAAYDLEMIIAATSDGAAAGEPDDFATSGQVFLLLSAKNAMEMYIDGDVVKRDGTFEWTPYSPQTTADLTKGDGEKVIYARFRNQHGIESERIESRIILDTSPPNILRVTFQDASDPEDADGWYHPGESVRVEVEAVEANGPEAEARIMSQSTGYDSGALHMDAGPPAAGDTWTFGYVWNTADLDEAADYTVEVTMTDAAGWVTTGDPAVLILDGSPPTDAKVNINGGAKRTASRIVRLEMSADDAVEMFIAGDMRDEGDSLRWIPIKGSMTAVLNSGEGVKNVEVKFRDMAENETDSIVASIILSQSAPVMEKLDSWDTSDLSDNDEAYHAGELVKVAVKAQAREDAPMIETGLLGTVFITSPRPIYNSGVHEASQEEDGWYTYTWNTKGLSEGVYQVTWNLSDGVGHEISDRSLSIFIDNTPPKGPQIAVVGQPEYTRSRSVTLDLQATGASWVFIDGDVLKEKRVTYEWVPLAGDAWKVTVKLAGGDGLKLIGARFKDDADNVTQVVHSQVTLDTVGPDAVSARINDDAKYTASTEVDLAIIAKDAAQMYIDGDAAAGPDVRQWIPYRAEVRLTLTQEDGEKALNVELKDAVGNYSDKMSDTIILDSSPPEFGSVSSANSEDPGDDDGRYLAGTQVRISVSVGTGEPGSVKALVEITSQESGYISGSQFMEDAGAGTYTYLWDTGFLQAAEDYTARVELKDEAGNSTADESLVMVILDKPVEQKVSINDGATVTTSQSVLLTLSADNAAEMYIGGDVVDDSITFGWIEFAGSRQVNLTPADGDKNVEVTFRDSGSRELGTSSASIRLDRTAPVIASVDTERETYRADGTAEIVIQAGKQESGLKGTVRVRSLSTGYDSGTQTAAEGAAGRYSYLWDVTGLKEGEDYRVEATLSDEAGWTAVDNSLTIAIDSTPPEGGSLTVNDGQLYTQKRSVKVAFVPPDDVAEVFIQGDVVDDSNTFQWVPVYVFDRSRTSNARNLVVNLTVGDGRKEMQVGFRDESGNEAKPIEAVIVLNELPPVILAVDSRDEDDPADDDGIYHAGQRVDIVIEVDDREQIDDEDAGDDQDQLEAWVQVTSQESGYDSGLLTATRESPSEFHVIWNTHSAQEASDYVVEATLQDSYGQRTADSSLIVEIDNTPPVVSGVSVGGGKDTSNSQSVMLTVSILDAGDPTLPASTQNLEMFIEGDVSQSADTFKWIQFVETKEVKLSQGDGKKNVTVKVRDSAGNVSEPVSDAIVLDRSVPGSPSIGINDGAEYTETHQVTLSLSARNAREMYISGDVVQDGNTFRWVPYEGRFSARLTEGEGEKTVRAIFRNGVDNESDEAEAQIALDFSPPAISEIRAFDTSDQMDDDLNFHSGQAIVLEATGDETGLKGSLFIEEGGGGDYNSGRQNMTDMGDGRYTFLWDTEGVPEGSFSCQITLEDVAGHSTTETVEILIDNQGPHNPSINILETSDLRPEAGDQSSDLEFAYSRSVQVSLSADGEPAEVFIAGDVVDDDRTFQWVPFLADENGAMAITLNLRGIDGEKKMTALFRDKARSESPLAEAGITLELKRPELAGSCRIVETDGEPARAYLALQFDEAIGRTEPKGFFLTLRDKASPQNVVYLDGTTAELVLSHDVVMAEIPAQQLDQIKQWQPMTLALSYVQAEIAENGVFDLADKGNLSNEQKPADVYFVLPASSVQVDLQPASFSPNDDGIKDNMAISYSPARTSDITIRIRDSQRVAVKEWTTESQLGGLVYSVEWTGKRLDGSPYPDGEYTVIIMGSEVEAAGFAYGLKRDFTIDNSAPQIAEVRPGEGAELPVSLSSVSVSVVDTPKMGGIESVYITVDGDTENRLPLAKSETEGEYVTPVISALTLPPGKHSVTFHAVDMAGNETEKTVSYTITAQEAEAELNVMNFPNPFPPGDATTIRYSLPEEARNGQVIIYDAGGDMVFYKELGLDEMEPGEHTFQWDGRDMFGNPLARGVYFCGLWVDTETEDMSKVHKIAIR